MLRFRLTRRHHMNRWIAALLGVPGIAAGEAWASGPAASAVAPAIPGGATLLPTGRFVKPAGQAYDLGDFSLGLAVSPNGRCTASSDEGWGNGQPVPAVNGVNDAGTQPD